jgi:uncharacterized protein
MRLLDVQSIEDIATGASFLGSGGGGDPYIGKLMAINALTKYNPIKLISVDECSDEAMVLPVAMMGAPSIAVEKIPNGNEFVRVFTQLEKYLGKKIEATYPIEAGGVNSMIPFIIAAQLGIPLIDCDLMGRAFPELPMVTFHLHGLSSTPMAMTDEKGNLALLETVNNSWAERFERTLAIEMGAACAISLYPSTEIQLKQYGIKGIVTLSEKIGQIIRLSSKNRNGMVHLLEETGAHH